VREQVGRYLGYSGRGANAFGKEARDLKPGLMNRKFRETCEVVTRREVLPPRRQLASSKLPFEDQRVPVL
jgi:hypothetical protein